MKNIEKLTKSSLLWGSLTIFFAIAFGAFGAHGLKSKVTPQVLKIFETGVNYHYYIGFSFFLLAFLIQVFELKLKNAFYFLISALLLFSGNLYLYVLTSKKFFALIVPLGGISFMIAYFIVFLNVKKLVSGHKS